MNLWTYEDDVDLMVEHIREASVPRPLHLSFHLGTDARGHQRMYLVASWKWADNVLMAWTGVDDTIKGQEDAIALWAMKARMGGLLVQGEIADYRCWPIPTGGIWTVKDPTVVPPGWVKPKAA